MRRSMDAIAGGWHLDVKSFWLHRVGNEERWLSAIAELGERLPARLVVGLKIWNYYEIWN